LACDIMKKLDVNGFSLVNTVTILSCEM